MRKSTVMEEEIQQPALVSCLRNTRIIVRFVPKSGKITNPKHVLYGGMAENATRTFTVPRLSSGKFYNVLTDSEKAFLESYMGLEPNALSVYRKENNFWDDSNPEGIAVVHLNKQDNYFDLSDPTDYIRYKVLLANKDFIAPSFKVLEDYPKATYQYVIIEEGDDAKATKTAMTITMECYKEYGKIEEDKATLVHIIETLTHKPLSDGSKLEFIQAKIHELIQANAKNFLKVIKDPELPTKVLIKRAFNAGVIRRRGDFYYLASDSTPLCENGQDPTINIAAAYLNNPKHQDTKFSIEALLNNKK